MPFQAANSQQVAALQQALAGSPGTSAESQPPTTSSAISNFAPNGSATIASALATDPNTVAVTSESSIGAAASTTPSSLSVRSQKMSTSNQVGQPSYTAVYALTGLEAFLFVIFLVAVALYHRDSGSGSPSSKLLYMSIFAVPVIGITDILVMILLK